MIASLKFVLGETCAQQTWQGQLSQDIRWQTQQCMRLVGTKHADGYLVVTLEEVVQVVPLTDRAACMVQGMPAALLEVVLTPAHQPAHALYASATIK